jgi:ketosteroid isomerase-like protein
LAASILVSVSQRNLDVVLEIYTGWAAGDFKVGQERFDEDIVFVLDFGFNRGTVRGRDAMRERWREELSNWENLRIGAVAEVRELGDCVVVRNSIRARGRHSGVEVEIPDGGAAFRFDGDTIVWIMASDSVGKAELAATQGHT